MITPSFGLTATERVLPKMALDFTTASLDSRVTFTRTGNTATCVNSSGNVAIVNADLPRFDFDPSTLACKGLLIEENRTNLLTYSQDFTNAAWVYDGNILTVSSNAAIAPDGLATAEKVTPKAVSSAFKEFQQNISLVAGQNYAFSIFLKADGYNLIQIYGSGTPLGTFAINYNLSSGTETNFSAGTSTIISRAITSFGNGWYRISVVANCLVSTSGRFAFAPIPAENSARGVTWTPNGTSSYLVWGAQIETGAFATSYIPTVASTVTRNADVATMTGANFSDWYTATTGAAVVGAIPQTATGTRPLLQFDDTTANEIIALRGNVANPELYIVDGGAPQAQIDAGTIVANTVYKLSGAWNTDSCAAAQNGAAAVTDNTATIPTPTQLRIGSDGTNYASAWVQKIMYYPQRIINAEVQAFSK